MHGNPMTKLLLSRGRFLSVTACLLVLCGCRVDLPKELAHDSSWTIALYQDGAQGPAKTVGEGSPERKYLLAWAAQNVNGWSLALPTYVPDVYVTGPSFALNIRRDLVVFGSGYIQYSKKLAPDDYQRLRAALTDTTSRRPAS